jgi:hypothetical protein
MAFNGQKLDFPAKHQNIKDWFHLLIESVVSLP